MINPSLTITLDSDCLHFLVEHGWSVVEFTAMVELLAYDVGFSEVEVVEDRRASGTEGVHVDYDDARGSWRDRAEDVKREAFNTMIESVKS